MKTTPPRKLLVIYTGGTIGMKTSRNGYIPVAGYLKDVLFYSSVLNNQSLNKKHDCQFQLPHSPKYHNEVVYDLLEFETLLDSSNMGMEDWGRIAEDIFENYHKYDAFVVLHGTDTMAFTASALSFMLKNLQKTVILTGSQLPLSELRNDGLDNILGALLIAGNYDIPEVGIYFNNCLLRGNRVTKVSTVELAAFQSGNYPPLVRFGTDIKVNWNIVFPVSDSSAPFSIQKKMSANIGTLRVFPGITKATMINFAKPPLRGLVLHTYGTGNAPTSTEFLEALEYICSSGITVVNCTQCFQGGVGIDYETGKRMSDIGVVSGSDMTVEAALSKLSFLLAQELDSKTIKTEMTKSLRGELTVQERTKYSFNDKAFINSVAEILDRDPREVKAALEPVLLCSCASLGDLEQLVSMVESGSNINSCDYDGRTALHLAASEGHYQIVKYIISQMANLNPKDRWGGTPLQDAIRHQHNEIVNLLMLATKKQQT